MMLGFLGLGMVAGLAAALSVLFAGGGVLLALGLMSIAGSLTIVAAILAEAFLTSDDTDVAETEDLDALHA